MGKLPKLSEPLFYYGVNGCGWNLLWRVNWKIQKFMNVKIPSTGFPGGSVVEFTCQCRRQRLDPWSGKVPRAKEQLSRRAATTEPVL